MSTTCFAIVRGSTIRVTELDRRGAVPSPVRFAVSKSVARVAINEVTDTGGIEIIKNEDRQRRLRFTKPTRTIRQLVDVEFLRVDPGVLSLVSGVPLVRNASGDIVGFDSTSQLPAVPFALEVWSKLSGSQCDDGRRNWGYTVFPHLRGGYLTGFTFANGLVSFTLTKAQTRRQGLWGYGPFDLTGPFERLIGLVSGNTSYRMIAIPADPPAQTDGIVEVEDVVSNGTPDNPMPDPTAPLVLNGGTPADAGPHTISGGRP